MRSVLKIVTALGLLIQGASPAVQAAEPLYPSKPVRMVVAFPPGGSADINARSVAQQLGKELGATVIIDNRGGAGGNIGAIEVKKSAPDGYTVFYATSAVVLAPSLYANPGFDPYSDFVPISLTATIPLVLVANNSLPVKTLAEFITWGKSRAGKVNYGSSGTGALLHLAGALFLKEVGVQATHVSYKGSAPAITDLIGGSTDFMFLPVNEASTHIKSGALRPLVVTSERRSPLLPDVLTMREATGKINMDMGAWQGLMAPKGTPADVLGKLQGALQRALADPPLRDRLTAQGSFVLGGTQKQYVDYMKAEGARWAAVVRETGARLD
ncbi:MAG: tripartite tricarboxylate transporter substrate binding protein [Curvibacter lanceolatus]|uniref:Bug family tripartite tricarboxylate transporter substrate binding protein n=1 Tax=Curvibacter lanceolatus TaxID=86182 RepID=UPI0003736524|nr:tripartite tricarboxylate transporter substrate binding protein [Curvibacter lanceolatus]MBV5291781.1 tripartite tricarboxylate transporter substrate binding protein [Curvibacter lanceolatus]